MTRPINRNEREDQDRYPKHHPIPGPRMVVDGQDLGAAMLPNDVLIELRHAASLDHDEIIQALHAAADRVEQDMAETPVSGMPVLGVLTVAERTAAVEAARAVTRSRVDAWRRRHRQMTWGELRMLLLGLRGTL